jgi:predicted metal-dependent hydrolase
MAVITDDEFGTVTLQRSPRASHVRIKVGTDGRLRASLPLFAPTGLVKQLIHSSRTEIRTMLREHHSLSVFTDGMQIGKSHTLTAYEGIGTRPAAKRHGQQITVTLPAGTPIEAPAVQAAIRPVVVEALRKEAKSYLPKRLARLAEQYGFTYQKVRFSHASGRWGSCSSAGTISLNIALMKLPFPLIDYVLLHELSHTVELNHSEAFWAIVEQCDPDYKAHRREIKKQTPSI